MSTFSIVIICKNAAPVIADTLRSVQGLTDDVLLFDNGSTDATLEIASDFQVRIETGTWEGYGATKNKANMLARHDWILGLDADESLSPELQQYLRNFEPSGNHIVYRVKRRNFLGNKEVRFGEWGKDRIIRMFNRKHTSWNDALVHELPEMPAGTVMQGLPGALLHKTMRDEQEYAQKTGHYASLRAAQYFRSGRKASRLKEWFSPAYTFFSNYILRLGFLDGKAGLTCASMSARYTRLKYAGLRALWRSKPAS